jgi:predicted AlkP superfamily phosphohydrolase/phosphomutase
MANKHTGFDKANNKVFVLGLDGATFALLLPLMEENRLPNFSKIISQGTSGVLDSTIPPVTPTAWASFMTGKNPGKHGVFGFLAQDRKSLINSTMIRTKKIWQLLSEKGKSIGVINVPLTYPPEEVNGFMISGFPTPSSAEKITYPENLFAELIKNIGDYAIDINTNYNTEKSAGIEGFLKDLKYATQKRKEALFFLWDKYQPDLLMVVFESMDRIQHKLWKLLDYREPQYKSPLAVRYRDSIIECYIQLDNILGEILAKLGNNDTIFIISDHGFGGVAKNIFLNNWLYQIGLLRLKKLRLIYNYLRQKMTRKNNHDDRQDEYLLNQKDNSSDIINWRRTRAFAGNRFEQGIYIHFPEQVNIKIDPYREQYKYLIKYLKEKLLELIDPETGERMVDQVFEKEEIYKGPYLEKAPDLSVRIKNYSYLISDGISLRALITRGFSKPVTQARGFHRPEGIFIAYGKNIMEGKNITPANIMDVAPTILYALNIPVPKEMDGRVLKEIFKRDYLEVHPVNYTTEEVQENLSSIHHRRIYSEDEEKEINARLKSLGYI